MLYASAEPRHGIVLANPVNIYCWALEIEQIADNAAAMKLNVRIVSTWCKSCKESSLLPYSENDRL